MASAWSMAASSRPCSSPPCSWSFSASPAPHCCGSARRRMRPRPDGHFGCDLRSVAFEDLVPSLHKQLLISCSVMPGLVPGIHVLLSVPNDVDGRDKPGHDDVETGERKMPNAIALGQERGSP